MKCTSIKTSDSIYILSFLHNFMSERDSNNIYGGTAMCLFPHFIRERDETALSVCVPADQNIRYKQESKQNTCFQVANYLL